jgi:NitT/TauT family transport system permease protein
VSRLWGIHARPGRVATLLLAAIPFALLLAAYFTASAARKADNPDDKVLPSFRQMATAVHDMALVKDPREDSYLMLDDTLQSLKRLALGVGSAAVVALLVGLNLGVFESARAFGLPLVTFVSIIPPLSLLPILFIALGVDELSKVALIFIGTFPMMARDIFGTVRQIPHEQRIKSLTLGASGLQIAYRIVLPQVLPRLFETMRLSLGAAWLFLIAAEAIAAEGGLGYRIFLVRRYLAMDIIIPYALWITLLGFAFDWGLRTLNRRVFPWYAP